MFKHGSLFWVLYCFCFIHWCFCDFEEFIWLLQYLDFYSLLIRELKPQVFVNINNSVASHFTSKSKFIQEEPEKWRPWASNLWWTLGQFREQKRGTCLCRERWWGLGEAVTTKEPIGGSRERRVWKPFVGWTAAASDWPGCCRPSSEFFSFWIVKVTPVGVIDDAS